MAKRKTAPAEYFGPPRTDDESTAFAHVLAHSFGRTDAEAGGWLATHDRENVRVLSSGKSVDAGLSLVRMGQYFGGLAVPMVGIQGVGVAPGARGRGVASELMVQTLRELHTEGTPLSTLYPANQTLYRRLGYEQAGHRFEVRIPLHRIGARASMRSADGLTVREARVAEQGGSDVAARVRQVASVFAATCQGSLERNELLWKRIELPPPTRTEPSRLFLIERGNVLEGYVFLTQTVTPTGAGAGRYDVFVQDMAAITPRAINRLWAFLAGYSTVGNDLVWMTGPANPLLVALPEQTYKPMTLRDHWMLRIVDMKCAMTHRGWPRGLDARLTLRITDDILRANSGAWSLSVSDGRARVRKLEGGGKPRGAAIKCDIGALSTLYAGFMSAQQLAMVERVEGSPDALELASAAFASTRGVPMLTDMF